MLLRSSSFWAEVTASGYVLPGISPIYPRPEETYIILALSARCGATKLVTSRVPSTFVRFTLSNVGWSQVCSIIAALFTREAILPEYSSPIVLPKAKTEEWSSRSSFNAITLAVVLASRSTCYAVS